MFPQTGYSLLTDVSQVCSHQARHTLSGLEGVNVSKKDPCNSRYTPAQSQDALPTMTPEAQTQSCEIALSKYRLLREIGRGNMGSVYLGRDLFIDRFIAVKVADQERLTCPETSQVF